MVTDNKLYKVAITVDGNYVHGKYYDTLTQVYYAEEDGGDGCSYISVKPNQNVVPGTDDTVWKRSSRSGRGEKGEKGDKGDPGAIDEQQIQAIEAQISAKQDALISGTNIKTVGGQNILGSGNIQVGDENAVKFVQQSLSSDQKAQARTNIGAVSSGDIPAISTDISADASSDSKTASPKAVKTYVDAHSGSGTDPEAVKFTAQSLTSEQKGQARANIGAQETLVSGLTIKTINSQSLLGNGNIDTPAGQDGVGIDSVSTPSTADGTVLISLTNGDTITLDLNHNHPQYIKYVHLSDEGFMPASPESDTLYLIDE